MEYQARRLAVERLSDLPPGADLFINIDPIIPPASPPIPAPPDRVVLEISESRSILDSADLMERILAWRRAGHRIAIDDYGAGYWGLGAALALRPDIVKIDRSVLVGAVTERVRQAAVQAVLYVCETLGAMVIAEGVETADEYELLKSLGVRYMQGWLWGHAQSAPNLGPMPLPDAPDRPSALLVPPFPKSSP